MKSEDKNEKINKIEKQNQIITNKLASLENKIISIRDETTNSLIGYDFKFGELEEVDEGVKVRMN